MKSNFAYKCCFWVFVITVLLAPLPFASNRPWSWSLLSSLIGILLILESIFNPVELHKHRIFIRRMAFGICIWFIVVMWSFIQQCSLFPSDWAHPLYREVQHLTGREVSSIISLNADQTRESLMRFLAYGGVFWLGSRFCMRREFADNALSAFMIGVISYAIYGLLMYFSGIEKILWFEKWAYRGDLVSTFVNRNTFATFLGLGILCCLSLMMHWRIAVSDHHVKRDALFFIPIVSNWRLMGALLILMVLFTALLLTHSRAGFLSTVIGAGVLILISRITEGGKKQGFKYIILLVLGFGVYVFYISGDFLVSRIRNTFSGVLLRDDVYAQVLIAILENPIFGYGYGSFEYAFMAFKTPEISRLNWNYAHNTYLELAFELGVPVIAAIIIFFAWLMFVYARGLKIRRRGRYFPMLGIGSCILVGVHSIFDFSLQIPGLTVSYALIAGMTWAQSWPRRR
jgi:O-antigen ligase